MVIQILGTGCLKCNKLEKNVKDALSEQSIDAVIEKVTDMEKIMEFQVMLTPALVIDGKVISSGKVLSKSQISDYLGK